MLVNLSYACYDETQYQQAKEYAVSCMEQMVSIGVRFGAISSLAALAGSLSKLGTPEKAARLLNTSAALLVGIGLDQQPSDLHEKINYTEEV